MDLHSEGAATLVRAVTKPAAFCPNCVLGAKFKDSLQALYPEPSSAAEASWPRDSCRGKPTEVKKVRCCVQGSVPYQNGFNSVRSLERSTGLRCLSSDCSPDWLTSVFLPHPLSFSPHLVILLLAPPLFSTFACSLWGQSFLTFGQVWVQVWHQCCTRNYAVCFFGFWSVVEIFWKTLEILVLVFFSGSDFFSSKLSVTSNAPFFQKLTRTSYRLGWEKWKHRVFKRITVSRTAEKVGNKLTGTQHHWSATCRLPKEEQSNPDRVHFKRKKKKKT